MRRSVVTLLTAIALLAAAAPDAAARGTSGCPDTPKSAQLRSAKASRGPSQTVCITPVVGLPSIGECVLSVATCAIDGATGGNLADAIGDAAGDAAGDIAGSAGNAAMDGIAGWFANGVGWVVGEVHKYLEHSTTPKVTAAWYKHEYFKMLALGGLLMLPFLMLTLIAGLFKADLRAMVRAMFVNMPLALIGCAAALTIAQMLLVATDAMTDAMTSTYGKDIGHALAGFENIGSATGVPGVFTLLLSLVALLGSLLVFAELVVRSAALYIVLLFLPIAAVAGVWPPAKQMAVKTLSLVSVVIVSKFFICVTFVLGAKAIAMAGTDDGATGIMAGAAMMFLAAASPAVVLGMISVSAGEPGRGHMPGPSSALNTTQRLNVLRSNFSSPGGSSPKSGSRGPSPIGGGSGGGSATGGSGGGSGGGAAGGGSGGAAAGGAAAGTATAGAGLVLAAGSALAAKTKSSASDIAADAARPDGPGLSVRPDTATPIQNTAPSSPGRAIAGEPSAANASAPQSSAAPPARKNEEPRKAPPHMNGRPSAASFKELPSV